MQTLALFLLALCWVCDLPLMPYRSNGLCTFLTPWASPKTKTCFHEHKTRGEEAHSNSNERKGDEMAK
jgi:hypothetical protein